MYPRKSQPIINALLSEFRIVYLTGPRQAGKTTLVKEIARQTNMVYVSLDDSAVLTSTQSDPHGFIRSYEDKSIVIDEFQYSPELVPAIKEASDNLNPNQKGKFLLTGSADIFSSAKTQEALPGHMARVELYPLSLSEIFGSMSNIIDYILATEFAPVTPSVKTREQYADLIINGGYPEIQTKSERARQIWFKSYMAGRLYKDFESVYAARGDYYSKIQALIPYLAGIRRKNYQKLYRNSQSDVYSQAIAGLPKKSVKKTCSDAEASIYRYGSGLSSLGATYPATVIE